MFFRSITAGAAALVLSFGAASAMTTPIGSAWKLATIAGEAVLENVDVIVNLGRDGTINGTGGCNTFMGRFVVNGDEFLTSPLATTMMMCEGPVSEQENDFFQALNSARGVAVTDDILEFKTPDGTTVLTLTRAGDVE